MQDREGLFSNREVPAFHLLYSHGQATIVVCEAYGVTPRHPVSGRRGTRRAFLRAGAVGRGRLALCSQDRLRYVGEGWIVMGLQSARMAGLEVPEQTLENVSSYLDKAVARGGSKYVYQPQDQIIRDPTMTAEALLCRQYLGWDRNDERLLKGVAYILETPIGTGKHDVYYWYYATQVCHHMEGEVWNKWNAVMRKNLPAAQVKTGAKMAVGTRNKTNGARAPAGSIRPA